MCGETQDSLSCYTEKVKRHTGDHRLANWSCEAAAAGRFLKVSDSKFNASWLLPAIQIRNCAGKTRDFHGCC